LTRLSAEARRRRLIDATIACLEQHGAAGLSVRNIAAQAGVSAGLVAHHFAGVEALLEATYRDIAARLDNVFAEAVAAEGNDPKARLTAYLTASFTPEVRDGAIFSAWIAFWSFSKSSPTVALAHKELYAAYRRDVERLLAACHVPAARLKMCAVTAAAMVDGLWLELCLDSSVFSPIDARRQIERWIAKELK
jgi:TetR/AcrR family transcriptional repressor of bet genes